MSSHTPGLVWIEEWKYDEPRGIRFVIQTEGDALFEAVPLYRPTQANREEERANAARLVHCWNEYDQLQADKAEVVAALRLVYEAMVHSPEFSTPYKRDDGTQFIPEAKARVALNNVKATLLDEFAAALRAARTCLEIDCAILPTERGVIHGPSDALMLVNAALAKISKPAPR